MIFLAKTLLVAGLFFSQGKAVAQIDFAPPNDIFALRTDLGPVTTADIRQEVFRASTELGDPVGDSVWWQWTAPSDGWWEVEIRQPENGYQTTAGVQVFSGDRLHSLIVAADGGIAVPEIQMARRLFQAKAGQVYQLAFQCPGPGTYLTESRLVDATLRPAQPAGNTTPAERAVLTLESDGNWSARGWSTDVTGPGFKMPNDEVLYAPLHWTWTCPAGGTYGYFLDSGTTAEWGLAAAFRGTVMSPGAFIDTDQFVAVAGEVFTFVTGNQYYPSQALRHHVLTVVEYKQGPSIPSNEQNPYLLTGALPRTVTPPGNAPKSTQLWWNWQCPANGWIEFDGAGLVPALEGIGGTPGTAEPEIITRNGKFYFWVTVGTYRLSITGWNWPAGGTFTLRTSPLEVPSNDLFSSATVLPSTPLVHSTGTFMGAGRQVGDPAATVNTIPLPTIWYRWQAPANGKAEVFFPYYHPHSAHLVQMRVFTGNDPAFLTEVPVMDFRDGTPLLPAHHQFTAGATGIFYLCFSGMLETFDLRIRMVGEGSFPTDGSQNIRIKTIVGSPVAEGSAPSVTSSFQLNRKLPTWFSWTAPGPGLLAWESSAGVRNVHRGPAFNTAVGAGSLTGNFLTVSAGDKYWFECVPLAHDPMPDKISLRLYFTALTTPLPGDDPAAAVSLGSQLPVGTACHLIAATVGPQERAFSQEPIRDTLRHAAWYRWTAPPGVQACEMNCPQAVCDVFADAPGGPRVASNADNAAFFEPRLFLPEPGRTYYFMVQSATGTNIVSVPLSILPYQVRRAENDDLGQALPLESVGGRHTGVLAAGDEIFLNTLSSEPDEPVADPAQPASGRSAWWKWIAPSDGAFKVDCLQSQHNTGDGISQAGTRRFAVGVYEDASDFSGLVRVSGIRSAQRPSTSTYQVPDFNTRRLAFQAVAGRSYLIQTSSEDEFGGISVSVASGDSYDVWALSQTGLDRAQGGPEDNPSGDGYCNLLKFCLGLNPALPLSLDPRRDRAPVATLSADGRTLSYSFWCDRFNTGNLFPYPANSSPVRAETVRLVAERSDDFGSWSITGSAVALGENRWRVDLPINGTRLKTFIRLRAEWYSLYPQ
ncbi:MAG: hypothetical protein JWL81_18 [Verrucomicrobiales bacterium]|nr:hypothetical protein [Verrucomicrobiales bacterium]